MTINKFIDYNNTCPICENNLTLFLSINDMNAFHNKDLLWKGVKTKNGFKFKSFLKNDMDYSDSENENKEEINLDLQENVLYTEDYFLKDKINRTNMHLFFICNEKGIDMSSYYSQNFSINPYYACYSRFSPVFDLQNSQIVISNPDHDNIDNTNENFFISNEVDNKSNCYFIGSDKEKNELTLMKYIVPNESVNDENFDPDIFENVIPLNDISFNFSKENRKKLFSKLESWIIMS